MRTGAFFAIALAGLALSACAPRYYDDRYDGYYGDGYYRDGYYGPPPGYYQDRGRYDNSYSGRDEYGRDLRSRYDDDRDHY